MFTYEDSSKVVLVEAVGDVLTALELEDAINEVLVTNEGWQLTAVHRSQTTNPEGSDPGAALNVFLIFTRRRFTTEGP
jgi:hypothetical protein